jgi:hypothetical protein
VKIAVALLAALAAAQTPPTTGSISGTVTDSVSGAPVANCAFRVQRFRAVSDADGKYSMKGLAPGRFQVVASVNDFQHQTLRTVTLQAGQDLTVVFRMTPVAHISGRVLDENKEPVPGVRVWTAWTEYFHGMLRMVEGDDGESDDQGVYTIENVEAGKPFSLEAQKADVMVGAVADAPPDPKLRKATPIRTYYPNAADLDGAERVTLRAGERRESADIHLRKAPAFCADGVMEGPNPLSFQAVGCTNVQQGKTGADGKFRVCNLHPGECLMRTLKSTANGLGVSVFAMTNFLIKDEDVHELKPRVQAPIVVSGDVVWDGDPPDPPAANKVSVTLRPIGRSMYYDDFAALTAPATLPGTFSFPSVLIGDYYVLVTGLSGNQYVKNIAWAGASVLHGTFRAGTSAGNLGLRVVVARDGGYLSTTVADKDGNPVDSHVVAMPADAVTDAVLADAMVVGQTDQNGTWKSAALAPGKYYVLAWNALPRPTPETIAQLRRLKNQATEIEVGAGATAQVKLSPR